MSYDNPMNNQIGLINFVMKIRMENIKCLISKLNMQKLRFKYHLCKICCNANHYKCIKQVYEGLMVDYLIVLTLDKDCSFDPSNIQGVTAVTEQTSGECSLGQTIPI